MFLLSFIPLSEIVGGGPSATVLVLRRRYDLIPAGRINSIPYASNTSAALPAIVDGSIIRLTRLLQRGTSFGRLHASARALCGPSSDPSIDRGVTLMTRRRDWVGADDASRNSLHHRFDRIGKRLVGRTAGSVNSSKGQGSSSISTTTVVVM